MKESADLKFQFRVILDRIKLQVLTPTETASRVDLDLKSLRRENERLQVELVDSRREKEELVKRMAAADEDIKRLRLTASQQAHQIRKFG